MASAQVIDLESYRARRRGNEPAAPSSREFESAEFGMVPIFWVPMLFWFPCVAGGD